MLSKLKGVVKEGGTVTAGNASGVNDGACAILLASETAAVKHGLKPRARVLAMATVTVTEMMTNSRVASVARIPPLASGSMAMPHRTPVPMNGGLALQRVRSFHP